MTSHSSLDLIHPKYLGRAKEEYPNLGHYSDEDLADASLALSTLVVGVVVDAGFVKALTLGPEAASMYAANVIMGAMLGSMSASGTIDVQKAAAYVRNIRAAGQAGVPAKDIINNLYGPATAKA